MLNVREEPYIVHDHDPRRQSLSFINCWTKETSQHSKLNVLHSLLIPWSPLQEPKAYWIDGMKSYW